MFPRVIGLFLGHSFLGWESLELGSVQRMGGFTREELLPQPRETRMCVRRLMLTLHVPEEETAATGPSQTLVDVPRASMSSSGRSGSPWGGVVLLGGYSGPSTLDLGTGRGRHGAISSPGRAFPLLWDPAL